jgi:hypothetical protein
MASVDDKDDLAHRSDMAIQSSSSSGDSSSHHRRRHGPGSAIAAAEAAASYILSPDAVPPRPGPTSTAAGRSNRFGGGNGGGNLGVGSARNGGKAGSLLPSRLLRRCRRRETSSSAAAIAAHRRRTTSSSEHRPRVAACAILAAVAFAAVWCASSFGVRRHRDDRSSAAGAGTLPPHSLRAIHGKRNNARVRAGVPGGGGIPADAAVGGEHPGLEAGVTAAAAVAPRRRHAIPPILIFTYHTDLLGTPASDLADEEDAALASNVRSITSLHPGTTVRFLDDSGCLDSIRAALGPDTNLTSYFSAERRGMYKADVCRGAALLETGGMYFDVDIEARMNLFDVVGVGTEFVTTLVHEDSNHRGGFFQAFIGSTGGHPILRRYLELFVDYYEGRVDVGGPLGVYLLRMAHDDVVGKKKGKKKGEGGDGTVDLWQEVRDRPDLFPEVTRDRWGSRRACQMLVVAPPRPPGRVARAVPLFSHANGSRMCGGKDTGKKG